MKKLIYIITAITLLSCNKDTFKTLSYTIEANGDYLFKQSVNDVRIYKKTKQVDVNDEIDYEITNKQQKKGDIQIVVRWYYGNEIIETASLKVGGSPKGGFFKIK